MFQMFIILPILIMFVSLGVCALVLWIGYRLVVSAVRAGILEANSEQARRDQGLPPTKWSILSARPADDVVPEP